MDDLISRRDAIDAVMKFMPSLTTPDGCGQFDREIFEAQEMFVDIGQALNKLPSAQPERKKGEWIPYEFGDETWHQCTACGVADKYIDYVKGYDGETRKLVSVRNYCPNCGALMKQE